MIAPEIVLPEDQIRRRRAAARARAIRRRRATLGAIVLVVAAVLIIVLSSSGGASSGSSSSTQVHRAAVAAAHRNRVVTFTVEASGDLLIHSPVWEAALADGGGNHYNFAALFKYIKPIIHGVDLPLCHVETPMTTAPPTGYPTFNTPPELATAIHQVGFKACSTAATHSLDQGQSGIDQTVHFLDHAGVLNTGEFPSAAAQHKVLMMNIKGVKVAFLSYTDITNGIPSPHPWSVNRASAPAILGEARRAREQGAQVVIVNLHWGDEYTNQPNAFQMGLARQLTASPLITTVVGQHVHVVQPIRKINGKFVVFGEGNLISNQTESCCGPGTQGGLMAILTIRVQGNQSRVTFVHYVPIWVQHPTYDVLPVGTGLKVDPADADALRASYAETVADAGRSADIQPIPAHLPK
jgi:Bacterial capsule synthesis protein PGA_cap